MDFSCASAILKQSCSQSQGHEISHLLLLLAVHVNISLSALMFVLFHSICPCSVSESVSEVLKLITATIHKIMLLDCTLHIYMGLPPTEMDVWWSGVLLS